MNITEQMIREYAYQLWERGGKPELHTEEFWFAAKTELELSEEAAKQKVSARIHRLPDVRCETAADWGKRGRDPSF